MEHSTQESSDLVILSGCVITETLWRKDTKRQLCRYYQQYTMYILDMGYGNNVDFQTNVVRSFIMSGPLCSSFFIVHPLPCNLKICDQIKCITLKKDYKCLWVWTFWKTREIMDICNKYLNLFLDLSLRNYTFEVGDWCQFHHQCFSKFDFCICLVFILSYSFNYS